MLRARPLAGGELTPVPLVPPVAPPAPVVDSSGAGDAFAAAFLLRGEPPRRCARYGALAGAHACTVLSTRADAIDRETLLARAAAEPEEEAPVAGP